MAPSPDNPMLSRTKLTNNLVAGRCYPDGALVSRMYLRRGIAGNQSQEAFANSRSAGGFGARTYGGPRLPPNRSHHAHRRDGSGGSARGRPVFVRRTAFLADLGRCPGIRAAARTIAHPLASPPRAHPDRSRRPVTAHEFHLRWLSEFERQCRARTVQMHLPAESSGKA